MSEPDLRPLPTGDPYNEACAAGFRMRKAEIGIRMTFQVLADASGIEVRQLKYFLNDQRRMHVGEFVVIARALGVDPVVEIANAVERVAQRAAQPDR